MRSVPPWKLVALVAGIAAWVVAADALAGDAGAFARTPRGFAFLAAVSAHGAVEVVGLQVTRETLEGFDPPALLLGLGFAGPAYGLWAWPPGDGALAWAVAGIGVLVVAAGTGLRAWAQATLGERFTAHVDPDVEGGLVTAGPYDHVRHPSYLALTLVFVGFPLLLSSPMGAAASVVSLVPFLAARLRHEEDRLREAFGDEYQAYAARTPMLLPRLRR